jgi:hypothetical protein
LKLVQAARPFVNPNMGFQEQLRRFAEECNYDLEQLGKLKHKK